MNFKIKTLALTIGLASTFSALPTYALIITSTVETSAVINVNGNVQADTSAPSANASSYIYGTTNNNNNRNNYAGGSIATGDGTGYSNLQSYGSAYTLISWLGTPFDMSTTSTVLHTATVTNDSAVAQNLNFNFIINSGLIRLGYSSIYNPGEDYINAGYNANIKVNGINVWNSAAKTELFDGFASSHAQLTFSGTSLNGYTNPGDQDRYEWGTYNGTLNLGLLNAGESFTLEYELNTYVNEHFIDEGYSHTPAAIFEDPFDFNASPLFAADKFVDANATPSSNVSEPMGAALLGLGLAGLAFRRKSKTAKA